MNIWIMTGLLSGFLSQLYAADSENTLQYDPFSRPAFTLNTAPTKASPTIHQTSELVLRGIIQADTGSMANINGAILREGDSYRGHKIIEIGRQEVVLLKNQKKIRLILNDKVNK